MEHLAMLSASVNLQRARSAVGGVQPDARMPDEVRLRCLAIAVLAVRSLHAELVLYPKPGLVSPQDNGSHDDMDAALFARSLFSLRRYFLEITQAGAQRAPFGTLRNLGIEAERSMMIATGGVNTHRGAIFALGLLCAATGYCHACELPLSAASLRDALISQWGAELANHSVAPTASSHGLSASTHYAVGGAREEAAKGFPSVFDVALPQLRRSLASGRSARDAQIDTFFSLMAHMNDTNVYHRGGAEGATLVKEAAQRFMTEGGTAHPDWHRRALECHRQFVSRRLSPGGAADMLAATWFVHQVTQWLTAPTLPERM